MHNSPMTEQLKQIERSCHFSQWQFDPADGSLTSASQSHRLQPRLSKLLAILLANSGELLSREQLIDALWQDKMVNEDALSRCIAELRATLGDKTGQPEFIETVPKKGYRFLQPIKQGTGHLPFLMLMFIAGLGLFLLGRWLLQPTADIAPALKSAIISAQRITTDDRFERLPKLSQSGELIAYSERLEGRLVVRIIDKTGQLLYTIRDSEASLYSPVFAPDDKAIFLAGIHNNTCNVYRYSIPELARTPLADCYLPSTSPILDVTEKGENLAYVRRDESSRVGIWVLDLQTGEHRQMTSPQSSTIFDTNPRFSADGQTLAYTHGTSSAREIAVLALSDPDAVSILTDDKHWITSISWLKDGRHLIFDSDEAGDRNIWLIDTQTQKKELLGARDAQMPSLDADNSLLTFLDVRFNANIWELDLNDTVATPKRLIESIKYNNHPAYSANDDLIAFVSNRKGRTAIWLYDNTSGEQHSLLEIPGLNLFAPVWSTDGQHIILGSRGKTGNRCYHVEIATGVYHPVADIPDSHTSCQVSSRDEIYAVTVDPERPAQILKFSKTDGVSVIVEGEMRRFELSESDDIVYSHRFENGLYLLTEDGESHEVIIPEFDRTYDGFWTVQGQYVYYPERSEQSGIWRYNLITKQKEFVTEHIPSTIGLSISVNHSHSKMLLSRTDKREADIYLGKLNATQD